METKQTGWVIIIVISITMVLWALLSGGVTTDEHEMIYLYLFFPVMLIPALLFYQLTIVVDYTEVKIRFGIGLIRKRWLLSDIESASVVKNTILQGWGIHYTLHTNIYNVSGMMAVELKLKNSIRKVRIGTAEPEKLADYINRMISKNKKSS